MATKLLNGYLAVPGNQDLGGGGMIVWSFWRCLASLSEQIWCGFSRIHDRSLLLSLFFPCGAYVVLAAFTFRGQSSAMGGLVNCRRQ